MLACLGVVVWLPVTRLGVLRLLESRLAIHASEGDDAWTLYLDRIPGNDVACRRGDLPPQPAPPDGAGHFVCTVPHAEGDTKTTVPLEIEYSTWLGFRRRIAPGFDAAEWADGKMWSGYYSSGYAYASFDEQASPRRFRFHVASSARTTVRYSIDSDRVDQVLPEGVSEIPMPEGARYVASCLVDRGRRSGTVLVRHHAHERPEVLEPLSCPLAP